MLRRSIATIQSHCSKCSREICRARPPSSIPRRAPAATACSRCPFTTGTTATQADSAVLEVLDLTARVDAEDGATILHGIGLRVEAGERVALVGESGSGKTMTAMAILGLAPRGVEVDEGSIRFEGRELLGVPDAQLNRIRGTRLAYI